MEGSQKGLGTKLLVGAVLGSFWERFGILLGPSWGGLRGSWEGFGELLGLLGAVLRGSGASWRGFGAVLKASEGSLSETCETQLKTHGVALIVSIRNAFSRRLGTALVKNLERSGAERGRS